MVCLLLLLQGWIVQTPPPSGSNPDIVVVGSKTSTSAPAVSFAITRQDVTIEEAINGLRPVSYTHLRAHET